MKPTVERKKVKAGLPAKLNVPFDGRPLLAGEDEPLYRGLATAVLTTLKPTSSIEMMWAKDIVNAEWDIQRLTILQSDLLSSRNGSADLITEMGEAYKRNSGETDRVSRMTILAEERRNRALHELERYRRRHNRDWASEIIDAEFVEAEPE